VALRLLDLGARRTPLPFARAQRFDEIDNARS
jgi:hypothetical protein